MEFEAFFYKWWEIVADSIKGRVGIILQMTFWRVRKKLKTYKSSDRQVSIRSIKDKGK